MNDNWLGRRTILLIAAITATSLAAWLAILLLIWALLALAGASVNFWVMTEALSTAMAVAAVFVAGFFAFREFTEVANSRHMEVADRLFEELNAAENIEARRWLFQNLPDDPESAIGDLPPAGRDAIKRVLNSLDRVAFLTQAGWIPEAMVMPWMSLMIVKIWSKLGPYVDYEGTRRGEPDYYATVRALAQRCAAWRALNRPDTEIKWLADAL